MPYRPRRITVYCGSQLGRSPAHAEAARAFGRAMAARKLGLVYGGGHVGLMGVVADAVMAHGGHAVGIVPRSLAKKEVAHAGLSELYVVATMHERKAMMATLGGAFVALPGGLGTLEELFEAWTWSMLGYHQKPVAVLNTDGYWDPLLALVDHTVREGFVGPAHRDLLVVEREPERLLARLEERARELLSAAPPDLA
jgi:hypothetical protein